jgi:hypothetical protein
MLDQRKESLINLTLQKASDAIRLLLNDLPEQQKGSLFEWYLSELYKGNGWLTNVQGGRCDRGADILLYHPRTPTTVSLIVQAKNQQRPLAFDQTRIELIKFEQQSAPEHNCNQFRVISVNGFVSDAEKLSEFNLLLSGWDYISELISKYDPKVNIEPGIELYAHNQISYQKLKKCWETSKNVAVVQATGTGKGAGPQILDNVLSYRSDQKERR